MSETARALPLSLPPRLGAMPDATGMNRLNRVQIAVDGDVVSIPWDSRDELLKELRARDEAKPVLAAFLAVGATRPVILEAERKTLVLETIRRMQNVGRGRLPRGLFGLLMALTDDLHEPV
jgi:hypothetical protein